MRFRSTTTLNFAFAAAVLAACGGGSSSPDDGNGNGTGNGPGAGPNDIDQALDDLGVNVTSTPRVDEQGVALPDDYSPLGSTISVGSIDDVLILGPELVFDRPGGGEDQLESRAAFVELQDSLTGPDEVALTSVVDPGSVWETDDRSQHPGMAGSGGGAQATRDAVAVDLDGDGRDEVAIVYVLAGTNDNDDELVLQILDSDAGATDSAPDAVNAETTERIATFPVLRDVVLGAGDLDGDGAGDLVVAGATDQAGFLFVIRREADGTLTRDEAADTTFDAFSETPSMSIELAVGNVDRDLGAEIVVVVNERLDSDAGIAAYWIFDDARRDYATLVAAGSVEARYEDGRALALVADPAIGDLDGDGVGEIVFGGLAEFITRDCDSVREVYLALDDGASADAPFARMGEMSDLFNYIPSGTGCNDNSHNLRPRHVHVSTLDVDGDGLAEVQANLRIFEDWVTEPAFTEVYRLPYTEVLREAQTSGGAWTTATTAMATADVNGDGRDDVISFAQWVGDISVFALDGPSLETATFTEIATVRTAFYNGQARVFPLLVPGNYDKDGVALEYSEGEYHFVFTEPILIAALAAAPCTDGIGQNLDACVTAYGTSNRQDVGVDGTVTVSASSFVSFEAKDPFLGIGAEGRASVTQTASFSAGLAYSLEETIEYETGSLEDTVIFTTVPLDQYVYTVLSHPDPELVGDRIVVNLPRTPITVQVERSYYNDHIPEGAFRVEGNVFLHTTGSLDSYPTRGDAEALIDTGGLGHLGPGGEIVDAVGEAMGPVVERLLGRGLISSRSSTVGQGGGQTATEIAFTEETSYRAGLEVSFEAEVGVSGGGVTVGTGIGGSVGAGVTWGGATTTVYRGTVGSIDATNYAENVYSFGLFTYIFNYGDPTLPQFEVLNYYVER